MNTKTIWRVVVLVTCLALLTPLAGRAPAQSSQPTTQPGEEATSRPAAVSFPGGFPPGMGFGGPASRPSTASAPREISLSLNNAPLDQVAKFISEQLDKPVMIGETVKEKKITIVSTKRMSPADGMRLLADALRQAGVVMEEGRESVTLRSLDEVKQTQLRIVGPDEPLADISEKGKIVEKIFPLKYYDPTKIREIIVPMLPSWGYLVADPTSRRLIVTDTVGNLERIEQVIKSLDIPTSVESQPRVFKLSHADAREILPVLSALVSGVMGKSTEQVITSGGAAPSGATPGGRTTDRSSRSGRTSGGGGDAGTPFGMGGAMPGATPQRTSSSAGGTGTTSATVVFVQEAKAPVVLMAESSRNWIIAIAPANILAIIEEWIAKLDAPSKVEQVFDIYAVEKANIDEVASQLQSGIDAMPDEAIRQSLRIVPFSQSRKLLVFGTPRGRGIVRDLLTKLDVDTSEYQKQRTFQLKYADAEEVVTNIDSLFSSQSVSYSGLFGRSYYMPSTTGTVRVRAVANTRLNTVTVITDSVTLDKIAKVIEEEWDIPVQVESVQPKVYDLKHADPVQVKTMLDEMFSQQSTGQSSIYDVLFGGGGSRTSVTPVGRLLGQFSFQAMANSTKLIVTTKNPSNYAVIDKLIEQLDQPQQAGLPRVIELKHANAEDIAEQLNALLAEPGTLAEITRSARGLTTISRGTLTGTSGSDANSTSSDTQETASAGTMRFWWQMSRTRTDEMPVSNMIGKIRFVPVNRRNALMVIAPQAYMAEIDKLVSELDQPGMQVLIHAVIAEVQHDDMTTLGLRIAADPAMLTDSRLTDTAIGGSTTATGNQLFGGTYAIGANTFGRVVLNGSLNVSVLIQLLMKTYNMKVLFEPKLYTADNQQSDFFDGQDVPIVTESRTSAEGTSTVSNVTYVPIGASLSVRPHITEEGGVDLNINLAVSRVVPGESVSGNVLFDRRETTTHVIVADGQTVMLSGIVHQEVYDEVRKVPLLGDIPLIGPLFRSVNKARRNRELVAFITPYVIDSRQKADERMVPQIEKIQDQMPGSETDKTTQNEESTPPEDRMDDVSPGGEDLSPT